MNSTNHEKLVLCVLAHAIRQCLEILEVEASRIERDFLNTLPISKNVLDAFPMKQKLYVYSNRIAGVIDRTAGEKTEFLSSIFAEVQLPGKSPGAPAYFRIMPLEGNQKLYLSPDQAAQEADMKKAHGEKLLTDWQKTRGKLRIDNGSLYTYLLGLLLRYGWCLPASGGRGISLYDQVKANIAVAVSLFRYGTETGKADEDYIPNDNEKCFSLFGADFAGIQNYLFTAARGKGAAKRLRARSFSVSMITEVFALRLLKACCLPITNLLLSSGGKIYILLPNTGKVKEQVRKTVKEEEDWIFKTYGGYITLSTGMVDLTPQELMDFTGAIYQLERLLQLNKLRPHCSQLQAFGQWNESAFVSQEVEGDKICNGCLQRLASPGSEHCSICITDGRVGKELGKAAYIIYYNAPAADRIEAGPGVWVRISSGSPSGEEDIEWVLQLNNTDLTYVAGLPSYTKFLANHVPLFQKDVCLECNIRDTCPDREQAEEGVPCFFDCLGARAKGQPYLGYLKADVDNMGALLSVGFEENIGTIAGVTGFCRMVDFFFGARIDALLRYKYQDCYTIFSGGDDLLLVGPWDIITVLAGDLFRDFRAFVSKNESITLSAGIGIFKPKYPVHLSLEGVKTKLEQAKEEGKNRCWSFGQSLSWPEYINALDEGNKLVNWVNNKTTNRSFLQRLLSYWKMYRLYQTEGKIYGLRYLPLLAYDLSRNYAISSSTPAENWTENDIPFRLWLQQLLHLNSKRMLAMGVIAGYAILATREEGKKP